MIGATLFSGLGAPEIAMPDWRWIWHAEIEAAPSAVLAARNPSSVNLGDVDAEDFVERARAVGVPDVVVFGSPCQSFSVAGRRLGLDDPRGNLALVGLRVVAELGVRWLVFENVPGLLSSYSGSEPEERLLADRVAADGWLDAGSFADGLEDSDFAALLSAFRERRYLGAYRVFDAQHSGVPQRRRRVFFVGRLGDWRGPAAVLLEPESLRGDRPPGREAGERVAPTVEARAGAGGGAWGTDFLSGGGMAVAGEVSTFNEQGHGWFDDADVAATLRKGGDGGRGAARESTLVAGTLSANGKASGSATQQDAESGLLVAATLDAASGRSRGAGTPLGMLAFGGNNTSGAVDRASAVRAKGGTGHGDFESETFVMAFDATQITHPENRSRPDDRSPQLSESGHPPAVAFDCKAGGNTGFSVGDSAGALRGDGHGGGHAAVMAFTCKDDGGDASLDQSPTLRAQNEVDGNANGGGQVAVAYALGSHSGTADGEQTNKSHAAGGPVGSNVSEEKAYALRGGRTQAVAFKPSHYTRGKDGEPDDRSPPLSADADKGDQDPVLMDGAAVRRLTPRECERLQAIPDDHTLVTFRGKPMADGPRYRMIGNSMCVLDVRWILARIERFEEATRR